MRSWLDASIFLTTAVFAAIAFGGCNGNVQVADGCTVGGVTYAVGDSFPAEDGCNTCTCGEDGNAACTEIGCATGCEYEGAFHEDLESFPAGDGCNTCTCIGGEVGCTEKACPPCEYNGMTYATGETFPAGDGCNTCTCVDSQPKCTLMECAPTCEVGGKTYQIGETFVAEDGCNTCACSSDGVTCTAAFCGDHVCSEGGYKHQVGDSYPAADGCNTCQCQAGGTSSCTELACGACTYAGVVYQSGDSFPALDGCNTCDCNGSIGCTKIACACDPAKEWYRDYVATDPDTCAVIDFGCPELATGFENECGCGCEQNLACPETFTCSIETVCDVPYIEANCPYSQLIGN